MISARTLVLWQQRADRVTDGTHVMAGFVGSAPLAGCRDGRRYREQLDRILKSFQMVELGGDDVFRPGPETEGVRHQNGLAEHPAGALNPAEQIDVRIR